ncbi:MAG: transglycosylase domain-containing protein [Myxococcales bacterium]|nr:transglycosylase domain-containing protein [Myxococcales bacterium]
MKNTPVITTHYPKWLILIVAISGMAAFGITIVVQWARLTALDMVQTIAQETNRTITVGRIVLDPRGRVDIANLRVSAPGDPTQEMLAFESLQAEIDLQKVLNGERMPRKIVVSGLRMETYLDSGSYGGFDDVVDAVRSLRTKRTNDVRPTTDVVRNLPSLVLTDTFVRVHVGEWTAVGQGELQLTTDAAQTTVAATGVLDTGSQSSYISLQGSKNTSSDQFGDLRLNIDPPITLPPHPLLSGRSVTLGNLRLVDNGTFELSSVHIAQRDDQDTQVQLASLEVRPRRTGISLDLDSIGSISAKGVVVKRKTQSLQAGKLTAYFAQASEESPQDTLERLLYRLTQLECDHCEATGLPNIGTVAAKRTEIIGEKWRKSDPLRGIAKLHVEHPQVVMIADIAAGNDDTIGQLLRPDNEESDPDIQPPPLEEPPQSPKSSQKAQKRDQIKPAEIRRTTIPTIPPSWVHGLRDIDLKLTNGDISVRGIRDQDNLLRLSGIDFHVDRDDASTGLKFTVSASLEEDKEQTAALHFSGVVDGTGRMLALDIRSAGSRLAQMLAGSSSKIRATKEAELGLDVSVRPTSDTAYRIEGAFSSKNIGFEWWRIASEPISGFEMSAAFTADFDPSLDKLALKVPKLTIGKLNFDVSFAAVNLRSTPEVDLKVQMPVQPCQHVFDSIPKALMPRLQDIRASGTTWFELSVNVDLNDPYGMKLELDGDLESCVVTDMGKDIDIDKINRRTFVHTPVVNGEELNVKVGPGTRSYVPLSALPTYVPWAAIATEDLDFYNHRGFKLSLIKRAIKMDLEHQRYVYGGSTISQQLVKNLFLSREKTLARKWEEAIITWRMEQITTKERILELYLNCIEYGPEIYGIRAASTHYFGKKPQDLTPLETSFLMGLKPCPSCGYRQWKKRTTEKYWEDRLAFIMKRLRDRGWITQEQFEAEQDYRMNFYYPGEGYLWNPQPVLNTPGETPINEAPVEPTPESPQ